MFCIHRIKDLPPFRYIKFPYAGNRFFNQKKLSRVLIVFLFLVFIFAASFNVYQVVFAKRIYYGVYLGPYHLGGKTREEAEKFLHQKIDEFLSQGFFAQALGEEAVIPAVVSGVSSSDIAYSLVEYDFENMIDKVFNYGRKENPFRNIVKISKSLILKQRFSPLFEARDEMILSILKEKFSHLETEPQNASASVSFKEKEVVVRLVAERNGKILDYESVLRQLEDNVSSFEGRKIIIAPYGVEPEIKLSEVSVMTPSILKVFEDRSFKISSEDRDWDLPREVLADWLIFKKENGIARLGLDEEKIKEHLQERKIISAIEIESRNAKFVFKDNKVIEFQASTTGRKVNYEKTVKSLEQFFFKADKNQVVAAGIVIDNIEPQIVTGQANTLGIEELIGAGETNFVGSPKNRIHNIKTGAQILSGLLIQPGETFSLNAALGEVGKTTGFKPELVIKGDKTIPEFGGGLCQIATTLFRAALNSGLPIVSRTNHSYRVSYYEPPVGIDATVYNPSPDLKFKNDTEAPILIQTKIEGTKLIFEFWGAKDSRKIEISTPVIFNITEPEPTKIIETTDLKPGEKKCTEKPHKGADTYFDYKVTYPNDEEKTKRFKSHYRAWQEVCLLGVTATSTVGMP